MSSLRNRLRRAEKHRVDVREDANSPTASSREAGGLRASMWLLASVLFLFGAGVGITSRWWWPQLQMGDAEDSPPTVAVNNRDDPDPAKDTQAGGGAKGHVHGAQGASLTLSPQGRKNIGLTLTKVVVQDFARTVSMPASIVGLPSHTEIAASAPMTGIVTRIHCIRGEAVLPGAPMFDLRLTHEDLVEKQSSLLRFLEELDVVKKEVIRLEDVTAQGAIAGKRLLERQYELQKIEAAVRAERQALVLHGLSNEQIEQIVVTRQLLREMTVVAPPPSDKAGSDDHVEYLQVAQISAKVGEHVTTGTKLATVTDHCELLIEGKAFEQDAAALSQVANAKADVTALVNTQGAETLAVPGLRILYVQNEVEKESRALKFYVRLPNELVRDEKTSEGHRFIGWKYRPGQRVELLVPVERWEKRIVLPTEAVVREGPEAFVYLDANGEFERRGVHVEYRDQRHVVIESDGTLFPGDQVAAKGAYQIHLALKNKSGGGADAHAGHHH